MSDGQIRIDTKIEQNRVQAELKTLQREIRNMGNEMKLANVQALMPFKKQMAQVDKKFYELGASMGHFKGTNAEFMAQVKQLGGEYKKATDNMLKADNMARMSLIRTAGTMLNMSSQASKISEAYKNMKNPMYSVNRVGLAVANSLDGIAKAGSPAVLALKQLGPNANMKQLQDRVGMITQGLMRFQAVALLAAASSALLYGALHKANMSMNPKYAATYTAMIQSLQKALQPMVQVFAAIMIPIYHFVTVLANLIIKFNQAHPVIAKFIQGMMMLIPLLTLLLSPLAIGIGLIAGMQAAFASLWTLIGPLVTGLAAMSATVWIVAAAITGLVAGITFLWRTNEGFRKSVMSILGSIQAFGQAMVTLGKYLFQTAVSGNAMNSFISKLPKGFQGAATLIGVAVANIRNTVLQLVGAVKTAFSTGDFSQLTAVFVKIAPMIVSALLGGIPSLIFTASRYLPAIVQGLTSNMGMLQNTANTILSQFIMTITTALPTLISIGLQILTSLINGITQSIPIVVPILISTFTTLINFITQTLGTLIPLLLNAGMQILMGLINGIVQNLPLIINAALQIITMLSNFLVQNLPLLINAGIQILMALIGGIMQMLPQLIQLTVTLITSVSNMLIQNLPLIIDAGIQILLSLVNGIIQLLPQLITTAVNLIVQIMNTLIQNLPMIIAAGIQILNALINGVIQILPELIAMAINLIFTIQSTLIQHLPQILQAGIQIILALIKGIVQLNGQMMSSVKEQIIDPLIDKFKSIDLVSVGVNIIQGLIDGIGSMAGSVIDKVIEVAGGIKENIMSMLGIHSPSRWMRDMVGKNMMLGWRIGIDKEKLPMLQKAQEMATWMMPQTPQIPVNAGASSSNVTNNTPISVNLNYSGNASKTDILAMTDILERELQKRFANNLLRTGVKTWG